MTHRSEYGLPLEYLNLNLKSKSKVSDILWRPDIGKYDTNESLHLL